MGWSYRRSLAFGPLRVNVSKSGVGVSAGVRGARISTGPRGTYIHVGKGGFRYSQRLDGGPRPGPSVAPRPLYDVAATRRLVEAVDPGSMEQATADELLDEIRSKSAKRGATVPLAIAGSLLLAYGTLSAVEPSEPQSIRSIAAVIGLLILLSLPWVRWWDRQRLTVRVDYEFDDLGSQVHEAIQRLVGAFERADKVWSVRVEDSHGDWKRNGGAGVSVDRHRVWVGWVPHFKIETNVRVGRLAMGIGGALIYFFPDRLLVFRNGAVQAVDYAELMCEPSAVPFIEEGSVPQDAVVIGSTWRYVNRDGGPDRRFANNRQLPVARYGVLDLSTASGLRLRLHISTDGLAEGAAELLRLVQEAIQDLRARQVPLRGRVGQFGATDEPPPLAAPARKAVQLGAGAVNYRWLSTLPEWAAPIVWGLVFATPAVALIFLLVQGLNRSTGILLGIALSGSGALITTLVRDGRRLAAGRAVTESLRSSFRAALISELRSKPAVEMDYEALVRASGLTRPQADDVADELYRLTADRFVSDGVVTAKERRKLGALAMALVIGAERKARLEAEASTERYRRAVDEALADGVITPEESRSLEALRANLGIRGS